jgi:hypothetical protein
MAPLSPEVAKKFFSDLYEESPTVPNTPEFDRMSTRLITSIGGTTSTGDQALQSLMFNHIVSSPGNAAAASKLGTVLGNIKQVMVAEFAKTFPDANLDTLIDSAKKNGYDVEVLKK